MKKTAFDVAGDDGSAASLYERDMSAVSSATDNVSQSGIQKIEGAY